MRKIGFIGLLAAVAAMMAIGVSSASANVVLCKSSLKPCPTSERYGPTTITASLQSGTTTYFNSGFTKVTCTGSTLENQTLAESGPTIPGEFEIKTFSGCTNTWGEQCRMGRYYAHPWREGTSINEAGQIVAEDEESGLIFNCGPEENNPNYWCVYLGYPGSPMTLQITGGNPATITANKVPLKKTELSNSLCSSTGSWTGTYKVTSPSPLFVGSL